MIKSNDKLVFVSMRKAIRLNVTWEEMEREFKEPIIWLRTFPVPANILRELRTYSRRGIWRLFRIEQDGIVEICQDGTNLKNSFIEVIRTVRGVPARKKGFGSCEGGWLVRLVPFIFLFVSSVIGKRTLEVFKRIGRS